MRFPKRIRHRGQVLATIYAKSKSYPAYRLAWRVAGKRRIERFPTYSEAKRRADALTKELAQAQSLRLARRVVLLPLGHNLTKGFLNFTFDCKNDQPPATSRHNHKVGL